MKNVSWPVAILGVTFIAAFTVILIHVNDAVVRAELFSYLDRALVFVAGASIGGAVGLLRGFDRGRNSASAA